MALFVLYPIPSHPTLFHLESGGHRVSAPWGFPTGTEKPVLEGRGVSKHNLFHVSRDRAFCTAQCLPHRALTDHERRPAVTPSPGEQAFSFGGISKQHRQRDCLHIVAVEVGSPDQRPRTKDQVASSTKSDHRGQLPASFLLVKSSGLRSLPPRTFIPTTPAGHSWWSNCSSEVHKNVFPFR